MGGSDEPEPSWGWTEQEVQRSTPYPRAGLLARLVGTGATMPRRLFAGIVSRKLGSCTDWG